MVTLSRSWQRSIEAYTFRELDVKSADLDALASILRSASTTRLSSIKHLRFHLILPTYNEDACAEYETDEDRAANNRVATEKISTLLMILSSAQWPADQNLALRIRIHSPMDGVHRGPEKLWEHMEAAQLGDRRDVFSDRYRYSSISVSDTAYTVPCVTRFTLERQDTRFLDPGSEIALTEAFPRLEFVCWSCKDPGVFLAQRRGYLSNLTDRIRHFQLPGSAKAWQVDVEAPYQHTERLPAKP